MATSFNKFYGKTWGGFYLNTKKTLTRKGFVLKLTEIAVKTIVGTFEIAFCLRDQSFEMCFYFEASFQKKENFF